MRHYTVNIPPSVGVSDDAYEYTVGEAFGQRAEDVRRQIEKTAGLRKQER
jgi:acetoin utilization deacetylase AcuC-like enzyme